MCFQNFSRRFRFFFSLSYIFWLYKQLARRFFAFPSFSFALYFFLILLVQVCAPRERLYWSGVTQIMILVLIDNLKADEIERHYVRSES